MARFLYRLCCGGLLGAQIFFAAAASQVAFRSGLVERQVSGNLVGAMLSKLDAATIAFGAIAAISAVLLGQPRRALLPIIAGLLAVVSAFVLTPMIHALRESGQIGTPAFGRLHGISASLMLLEMILLAIALWFEPN